MPEDMTKHSIKVANKLENSTGDGVKKMLSSS